MRKDRPQCGLLIENKEGKVLLQLRDNNPDIPYPDCWGTFGRQVEDNESPEEAIKREIFEEIGYELSEPEYFGNFPFDGYNIYMYRKIDIHLKLDCIKINEGQEGRFFSMEEIRETNCAFNCKDIVFAYYEMFH